MEYEPEFFTFAFKKQCGDSLHESILASISSLLSPSHEALLSVTSSFFLELKPFPNTLKYAFIGPDETFPMIIADDLNSN